MARIVCQVLQRGNRITFIWSEGAASFEPYHLEGSERIQLLQIAADIHAIAAQGDQSGLVSLGHRLHRSLFRRDAHEPGSAEQVHTWLGSLIQSNGVERLDFLGDTPGAIPFNYLTEDPSAGFWGARFNLGAGRRVNPLRGSPAFAKPTHRFAVDPDLAAQLTIDQQPMIANLRESARLVQSASALQDELAKRVPDVLGLVVRFNDGQLHLGSDAFGAAELDGWLGAAADGNPDPILILMASGDAAQNASWSLFLASASTAFNGLIANEVLLPAEKTFDVGHALVERFAEGKHSLGEILQALRKEKPAALAFSAFCPPQVRVVLEGEAGPEPEDDIEAVPLPRLPYRPFAAFEEADRALFFGREDDILHAALVADQADAHCVLLHGSPAVGKTSFLQAGLLPYLEQECVGYRVLRDRSPDDVPEAEKDYPILILRCTNDLAGQFADALLVFCAQPLHYTTPAGNEVSVDLPALLEETIAGRAVPSTAIQASTAATSVAAEPGAAADDDQPNEGISARDLWIAVRDDPDMLGKLLDAITRSLPFELVIVVDQGEELVTLTRSSQQQDRRHKALEMLTRLARRAPRCKIVYTIRSQALGQFISLLPNGLAPANWQTFYLRPLTEAEMVDALLWPTNREEIPYCDEAPYQKYGFSYDDGMAGQIVAEAIEAGSAEQQSPLPILQAAGGLLYEQVVVEKHQNVLRLTDLKDIGGVRQALSKYLDNALSRLPITNQARQALRDLIARLSISHSDGTLSRDVIPAGELKDHWNAPSEPAEPIVNQAADEQGLFDIQQLLIGGQADVFVSLPQDSLAQLGKKIRADKAQQTLMRAKVIDVLWIMIPVAFLAAAMTFYFTRNYLRGGDVDEIEANYREKIKPQLRSIIKEEKEELLLALQRPIYLGQVAQADQAIRDGNAPRARQILISQLVDPKEFKLPDLRGFEWKYLWRQLNNERFLLDGHRGEVTAVAIAPDSKRAASASADGTVRIWDLANGKTVATIAASSTPLFAVAFAPDGKTVASAGADKLVRLWDVSDIKPGQTDITKELKTLTGHTDVVRALAFAKDANTLASAGADKTVILWDVAAGKEKFVLKEHTAGVLALVFAADGKTLVSAGDEADLLFWDADTGKKRAAAKTNYRSIAALASADGKVCTAGVESALGIERGMVRFWNVADATETLKPIQTDAALFAVAFAPDGKTLATAGKDRMVHTWDVDSQASLLHFVGHLDTVKCLAFAKDGSALVSGSADQKLKVWDPAHAGGPNVIHAHKDWAQAVAVNRKGTLIASGARDGSVKLWDAKTAKLVKDLPPHPGAVTSLGFSNHDKDTIYLAVGTRDAKDQGAIKIWKIDNDPKEGWKIQAHDTLLGHKKGVTCLDFSRGRDSADLLVSGSADQTVRIWDVKTGKEKLVRHGHKDEVRCVAFSFENRSFVSGGKDGLVCFYDLDHDNIRRLSDLQAGSIEAISLFRTVSPDVEHPEPRTAILTGGDQGIQLWVYNHLDPNPVGKASKVRPDFRSHTQPVTALAHYEGNDGLDLFVSSSWDGTVKLYELSTERFTLVGHQGPVRAFALASDQSFLVSAGNDGTIRIWRAATERGGEGQK